MIPPSNNATSNGTSSNENLSSEEFPEPLFAPDDEPRNNIFQRSWSTGIVDRDEIINNANQNNNDTIFEHSTYDPSSGAHSGQPTTISWKQQHDEELEQRRHISSSTGEVTDFSAHGHGTFGHGNGPFKKRHLSYGALAPGSSPNNNIHYTHHNFYNQLQQYGSRISYGAGDPAIMELSIERLENLQEMRPLHLIGKSAPMRDWSCLLKSDKEISRISKSSHVRQFYRDQNDLIERYVAIDRLLDSGMPVSMLRVYGDDIHFPNRPSSTNDPRDSVNDNGEVNNFLNDQAGERERGGVTSSPTPANDSTRQGAPANIDIESSPLLGQSREERSGAVMFAIYVNFGINFLLLIGKTIVVLLTNSLSVVASLVDSVLDFLSTFIIWISTRLVDQRDWKTRQLYPVGRSRLEPIGVLVFSVLIIVSFLKVADEAVEKLLEGRQGVAVDIGIYSIIIMSITIIVKVFCWLWCRSIEASSVQALAQDAVTDIVFK